MNYERHFQLKHRLRIFCAAMVGLFSFASLCLVLMPIARGTWWTVVLVALVWLAFASVGACAVMARGHVLELERMDREDRDEKPWLSRPRFDDHRDQFL